MANIDEFLQKSGYSMKSIEHQISFINGLALATAQRGTQDNPKTVKKLEEYTAKILELGKKDPSRTDDLVQSYQNQLENWQREGVWSD